jgi:hypothetical protein
MNALSPQPLSSPSATILYPDLKDYYNSTDSLPPYPGESTTQGQQPPRPGLFPLQALLGEEFGH